MCRARINRTISVVLRSSRQQDRTLFDSVRIVLINAYDLICFKVNLSRVMHGLSKKEIMNFYSSTSCSGETVNTYLLSSSFTMTDGRQVCLFFLINKRIDHVKNISTSDASNSAINPLYKHSL